MARLSLVSSLVLTTLSSFRSAFAADMNCTLCVDPMATPNDPDARINTGTETLTCQDLYDLGTLMLPEENCTSLQTVGRVLCLCESEAPTLNPNCTLCEDGSALPRPLQEGLPGESCAELQVDAQRDDEEHCNAWQGTVGVYCGCSNNVVSETLACSLCNGTQLPAPLDVVPEQESSVGYGLSLSCGQLELEASLPGANCSAFQEAHSEYCCRNVPPPPIPTSGVPNNDAPAASTVLLLSLIALMCAV